MRAARLLGAVVLTLGLFWVALGLVADQPTLALLGLLGLSFGLLLVLEARRSRGHDAAQLATRLAVGTLAAAIAAVVIEPIIGTTLAIGSLIPVVLALPYVTRATLNWLMAGAAVVGSLALTAPAVLPWGQRPDDPLGSFLPVSTVVTVFVLFLILLRNASRLLADTAGELRAVVAMSRDLSETLDPLDVGNRLARHIARATGADDCAISTWDRAGDRVLTFGYYPADGGELLEPAFDLARYPATRAVLLAQTPVFVDVDDPSADRAEVEYLRSVNQESMIMLPLVARGESIGIVELGATSSRAFGQRQLEVAQLLVREAAVTFDNARLYDALRQQAFRDSLTGLANRARFNERVDHALDRLRGRSELHVAVLFIDLDHFKLVNDRFGHTKGDRVLHAIGERIRSVLRPGDTPARLGGDEFAVLLEDVSGPEVAAAVSQRVLDALTHAVDLDEAAPIVGGSIGIAISGPTADTTDDLLRNADIAMYAAKAAGRGQIVHFRPDLLQLASARSELAAMLRGAESRRELQLHYQPIVRLADGEPVGIEALVRWQPQGHSLHMPAEFMSLAEETGEIVSIGRWVIGEACRRTRTWQRRLELPGLRLHVNLSARQFRDPGLVPLITGALDDSGLDPGALTLEITESTLLTPNDETVERIAELRQLGARLAIDDFGTGYSSLGYLHAFQIDELKIDRSFVPTDDGGGDAHVLSQAIVELGRALGLEIIAEGIETEAQAEWFLGLGCLFGQGYRYARPMPADEMERYLRRDRLTRRGQIQSMRRSNQAETAAAATASPVNR